MPVAPLIPESTLPGGGLIRWLAMNMDESTFLRQQALREALGPLLAESPARLDVVLHGDAMFMDAVLSEVAYVGCINRVSLPKTVKPEGSAKKTVMRSWLLQACCVSG